MNTMLRDYDDIIVRYTVHQWDTEPESSRFKAEIQFTDNSILMVKFALEQLGLLDWY